MSKFFSFLHRFNKGVELFKTVYKCGALELIKNGNELYFHKHYDRIIDLYEKRKIDNRILGTIVEYCKKIEKCDADWIETYLISKAVVDGPKIFKPRQLELEMCEHMKLNIEFNDYVQPFETVIIELPDDYIKTKRTRVVDGLNDPYYLKKNNGEHEPVFIIMNWNKKKEVIFTGLYFSSDTSIKSAFAFKQGTDEIEAYIEEKWNASNRQEARENFQFKGAL